jgi:serine-type D-Ala-D-Ala carboxypeptidase/endopeptidase (penicillin-binding protein 4)
MRFLLNLIIVFFVYYPCLYSQHSSNHADKSITRRLNEFKKSKDLKNAEWSVYAEYVKSGRVIVSFNSNESLAPASGLKVFTTSASLFYLGENYKFITKLYYDGSITNDSTLNGNIYIVGDGDPTLGSSNVNGSLSLDSLMITWVNDIRNVGIKKIDGKIIADNLLFDNQTVPDYWIYEDIGNYYGAGPNALTINDNLYYLFFKPGAHAGDPAQVLRMEPVIPGLNFTNYMKTGPASSGDNGYIYDSPEQFNATLRGTVPAGVPEFYIKGSIPDPPLFAAQYLTSSLEKNGIEVSWQPEKLKSKKLYNEKKLITVTISPPLKDIVFFINKRSDNLYAEQLLKTIGLKIMGESSTQKGTEAVIKFLKENDLPTDGIELFDGSGLSRTDMITSECMVKLLSFIAKQKFFENFYNSLGIAGDPNDIGYFKNYGVNTILANNARIKDGLLTNVRSHSGYLKDRAGRLIAFSMIANNFSCRTSDINKIHEKVLLLLANLK